MQFEKVTIEDLDEIRNLQPQDWSDIIPEFEFYIQSPFCSPIKTQITFFPFFDTNFYLQNHKTDSIYAFPKSQNT